MARGVLGAPGCIWGYMYVHLGCISVHLGMPLDAFGCIWGDIWVHLVTHMGCRWVIYHCNLLDTGCV